MRKSDIKVGKTYSDEKGGIRLIVAEGPEYVLYSGQAETENLRYRLLAKKRGPGVVGSEYNQTRTSFATWAKKEVNSGE